MHAWGCANRVTFDAGNEDTMIMSTVAAFGGPVELFTIAFDTRSIMDTAAHKRTLLQLSKPNHCYVRMGIFQLHFDNAVQ